MHKKIPIKHSWAQEMAQWITSLAAHGKFRFRSRTHMKARCCTQGVGGEGGLSETSQLSRLYGGFQSHGEIPSRNINKIVIKNSPKVALGLHTREHACLSTSTSPPSHMHTTQVYVKISKYIKHSLSVL